jgi:hypothetical protein
VPICRRVVGYDQCARPGQRLQACGEIWRLPDHPALLRGTCADQIADHDKPAGDAEPHVQRLRRDEATHRFDHCEPGADRPLGIVLVRLGVAEVDQDPVAHILGDKPGEAPDCVGYAAVVGADDLAQILGIEARRQRGRTDQINEHHGQLAPLGLGGGGRPYRRRRSRQRTLVESGNRGQQPPPIAERSDADFLQVVRRQPGQHVPIDRVFAEGRRVLLEAQPPQPVGNVHGVSLPPPAHPRVTRRGG